MVLPALPALGTVAAGASSLFAGTAARAGVSGLLGGLALPDLPLVGGLFGGGGSGDGGGPGFGVLAAIVGVGAAAVAAVVLLLGGDE